MARLRDTGLFSDANLVAYYEFDSGALTTDSKGSNTLTNNNTVGTETSGQKYGTGAADTGTSNSNKYLSLASGLGVDLNGAFTVSFWVKVRTSPTSGNTHTFVDWRSTTGTSRYVQINYQNSSGNLQFYIDISGGSYNYAQNLGTTDWHHVAITCSAAGSFSLYVNGVLATTGTRGSNTSANTLTFAAASGGASQFASVYIDDAGFFSRELTASQINTLYQAGGSGLLGTAEI